MKIEERRVVSRDEVAKLLLDTAKRILKDGTVSVGAETVSLPETLELELELKHKKGRTKFEIELVWPEELGVDALYPEAAIARPVPTILPSGFKAVKKEMRDRLQLMSRSATSGGLPSSEETRYFEALAKDFQARSKSEWRPGADAVVAEAARLGQAVAAGDREGASSHITKLLKLEDVYHQRYK